MTASYKENTLVYRLSLPNGKSYIGVTTDLERRLSEHRCRDTLIGRAIRKHGEPSVQVLVICSEDTAYDIERKAVLAFNTLHPNGYNLMGGGMGGRKVSHRTRKQMSESHTGLTMPPEVRQKISDTRIRKGLKSWLGRKHSEATKAKIAEAGRKRRHSVETRNRISKSKTGVKRGPVSEETRRKISEGQRQAHARRRVI